MQRPTTMRWAHTFTVVTVIAVCQPGWGQAPISIPGPNQGYQLTPSDTSKPAPPGYEGRTDIATQTAVGITPETSGKTIVSKMTLSNQIKTCPNADGTAEGIGEFSVSIDFTNKQGASTSKMHIEMSTKAKYKGQVGDNALLQGPVNGDMDYTYSVTGSTQNPNGAATSFPPSSTHQHITIPIVLLPNEEIPSFGPFSGGDPAQAHYSEAFSAGQALAFWAGVYYSVAETKWYGGEAQKGSTGDPRQGACVDIAFDPPGNTLQPPLGAQATVHAVVKTKSGEIVPAHFVDAQARSGGNVAPQFGESAVGSPLEFTYTAPNKKTTSAGFGVGAYSRAGAAVGEWKTGLGSGWSGQITYQMTYSGDVGNSDLQDWSNSSSTSVTVDVKDGLATYHGHVEKNSQSHNRHPVAAGGGHVVFQPETSDSLQGTGDGDFPAKVEVNINESNGTYGIQVGQPTTADGRPTGAWSDNGKPKPIGKEHWEQCYRSNCTSGDRDIGMPSIGLNGPLSGKFQDPNHIQASYTERKEQLGRGHNATMVETTTVTLARSGSTNRAAKK